MGAWNVAVSLLLGQEWPLFPGTDSSIWKGAFCIPAFFPEPRLGSTHLWTPAYGVYDDATRAFICQHYPERGYTDFVYNCVGLPYGTFFPELADDPARVARDLKELYRANVWPVVCATDDRLQGPIAQSFIANGAHIRKSFPMWEMNGVLRFNIQAQLDLIRATKAAAPNADVWIHLLPGEDNIGGPDPVAAWKACQDAGSAGLLAQGSNDFATEDPTRGGEGLESTAVRLLGLLPTWAGLHQRTVKFEYGVHQVFFQAKSDGTPAPVTEQQQRDYTRAFLAHAPHVVGFGDGG